MIETWRVGLICPILNPDSARYFAKFTHFSGGMYVRAERCPSLQAGGLRYMRCRHRWKLPLFPLFQRGLVSMRPQHACRFPLFPPFQRGVVLTRHPPGRNFPKFRKFCGGVYAQATGPGSANRGCDRLKRFSTGETTDEQGGAVGVK